MISPSAIRPKEIKQESPTQLAIVWSDGHESVYDFRFLRAECRCANCIHEWTGERLLDPESVDRNVYPLSMQAVGRYAVQFKWSDGHDAGIYTYEMLRETCPCAECSQKRGGGQS